MGTNSTSPGPSEICPKLATMTVEVIVPVLHKLFRIILDERMVPDINLLNLISPLITRWMDQSKPGSYRPVSLTEFYFWVLEKVLKTKLAAGWGSSPRTSTA